MARTPLFNRLPEAWKRLDNLYGGVLEKYLGVFDDEYDNLRDKIESVLDLRTPNKAPDEFLPLLGRLVGHEWAHSKSYNWNRQRIMIAIRRYSYKGTQDAIDDVVTEAGGDEWWVVDMASTVIVPSRQGNLGTDNCFLVAPDYHHPGAYELQITAAIDYMSVVENHLARNTAAGEYWYLKTVPGTIPGDMAVKGGLLTMDSLLDLTKTEIQLHEGTLDNPLSGLDAVIQSCDETV